MENRIEIIIADDQKLFREAMNSLLKNFNIHTIGEAGDGNELMALLEIRKPEIVLLDIEMPFMNGLEIINSIRQKFPEIAIIMLSQYNEETLIENCISRGASGFLTKSTDIEIIVETLRGCKKRDFIPYDCSVRNFALTKREIEIIPLICKGKSTKEIALALNLNIKTVEAHRKRIYKKTKSGSLAGFLKIAFKKGLNFLEKDISGIQVAAAIVLFRAFNLMQSI